MDWGHQAHIVTLLVTVAVRAIQKTFTYNAQLSDGFQCPTFHDIDHHDADRPFEMGHK